MRSTHCRLAACIAAVMLAGSFVSAMAVPVDHALSFDGLGQFVTVADPVQVTDGPFSLEAWIWMESCTDVGHRILSNRHGANGYMFYIWLVGGNTIYLSLALNGTLYAYGTLDVPLQQWVHVAATWTGAASDGYIKLYANGQDITSAGYCPNPIEVTDQNLLIGCTRDGGFFFHGLIDDVRIWSVALDQATIQAWMNRPVDSSHPNWSDLRAYWKLDEGIGQTAASEVNSPAYDGTLGTSGSGEAADPVWTDSSSPVPVEPVTLGRLKWGWLQNAE